MKKISLLLGVVALMSISLTSCQKEWTCTCTTGAVSVDVTIDKTTKADAKEKCDALDIGALTDCSLK
jgi:hypothetical protein